MQSKPTIVATTVVAHRKPNAQIPPSIPLLLADDELALVASPRVIGALDVGPDPLLLPAGVVCSEDPECSKTRQLLMSWLAITALVTLTVARMH
jgi:hypothetical protein